MVLIYRAETNFQLKGTAPVKLPLVLNGESLISCLVESKQAKPSWRYAGDLEQFAFLPELGNTVLKSQRISFGNPQLFELELYPVSYLRFAPVAWLKFRTNITINKIESMPIYQDPVTPSSSVVSATAVPVSDTQVLILAANEARLGFSITNASGKILFIDFDGNAAVSDYGVRIPANSAYEPPINYTGDVYGVWNGPDANGKAFVREFL